MTECYLAKSSIKESKHLPPKKTKEETFFSIYISMEVRRPSGIGKNRNKVLQQVTKNVVAMHQSERERPPRFISRFCEEGVDEGKCGAHRMYDQGKTNSCFMAVAYMIAYRTPVVNMIRIQSKQKMEAQEVYMYLRTLSCNEFNLPKNIGAKCSDRKSCEICPLIPGCIFAEYKKLEPIIAPKQGLDHGYPLSFFKAILLSCDISFSSHDHFNKYSQQSIQFKREDYRDSGKNMTLNSVNEELTKFMTHPYYTERFTYVGSFYHIDLKWLYGEHVFTIIRCFEDCISDCLVLCDSSKEDFGNYCRKLSDIQKTPVDRIAYFERVLVVDHIFMKNF